MRSVVNRSASAYSLGLVMRGQSARGLLPELDDASGRVQHGRLAGACRQARQRQEEVDALARLITAAGFLKLLRQMLVDSLDVARQVGAQRLLAELARAHALGHVAHRLRLEIGGWARAGPAFARVLLRLHHVLQHAKDGARGVGDVLRHLALALACVLVRLRTRDLVPELLAAVLQRLGDGGGDFRDLVADVLLAGALERDLGAHDAHEDAHLVRLGVDLVLRPLEAIGATLTHVAAGLEEQRNAVGKAVHRQPLLQVLAADAHRRLHHEGVALVRVGVHARRGAQLGSELLVNAQVEVVLARGAQALARGRGELDAVEELVDAHDLVAHQLAAQHVVVDTVVEQLVQDLLRQRTVDAGKVLHEEMFHLAARRRLHEQLLEQLKVHVRRVVLSLHRHGWHGGGAPLEGGRHAAALILGLVAEAKFGVGRDDSYLLHVLEDLGLVRAGVACDGDAQLGAVPARAVGVGPGITALVRDNIGLILRQVNAQLAVAHVRFAWLRAEDFDGQAG
mmetsp:Transcript_19626/g.60962  ORF Transcript_19626/g.60962 Transcript_19626/m.60962 type:complete len:510 (+) Transcript_19626:134-1663(+)